MKTKVKSLDIQESQNSELTLEEGWHINQTPDNSNIILTSALSMKRRNHKTKNASKLWK